MVPVMTVRILLKSWATPPVSWPIASIFWACRSWASAARFSETSRPMKKCRRTGSDQLPIQFSVTMCCPSLCGYRASKLRTCNPRRAARISCRVLSRSSGWMKSTALRPTISSGR